MSNNNRRNRILRRHMHEDMQLALNMFYRGELERAEEFLRSAASGFSIWGARGLDWDCLHEKYAQVRTIIQGRCSCWHCVFTPEQKRLVQKQTEEKARHLSAVYAHGESNRTGAFAEVVFGTRFGLNVNLQPGFDGGVDYEVPCARSSDGVATIDIKGTQYGELCGTSVVCNFPPQKRWRERDNHIYVLLHVLGHSHIFFRGFAYGDDPKLLRLGLFNSAAQRWKSPSPSRSLSELEQILRNEPGESFESRHMLTTSQPTNAAFNRRVVFVPKQAQPEALAVPEALPEVPQIRFAAGMSVHHLSTGLAWSRSPEFPFSYRHSEHGMNAWNSPLVRQREHSQLLLVDFGLLMSPMETLIKFSSFQRLRQ